MKTKLVKIGNSRGVRLPKAVIEQANLEGEILLTVRDGEVILKSSAHPRAGWDEAMKAAIAQHGNELTEEDREWLDAPIDAPVDEGDERWWRARCNGLTSSWSRSTRLVGTG